jgi:hypothetical protein
MALLRTRALVWLGLGAAACSSPTAPSASDSVTGEVQAVGDALVFDPGKKDATAQGDATQEVAGDAAATDALADDATDDVVEPGDGGEDAAEVAGEVIGSTCNFASNPASGEPGHACASNGDCQSALCIASASGKICTQTCISCCPDGFACEQMPGQDSIFACLPKLLALCRPCTTDAECGAINPGAICVGYGDTGSFCGGGCASNGDCPGGYACEVAQGQKGSGKQCVRKGDVCGCSVNATLDGAETVCHSSNDAGSCGGTRKCGVSDLTACSAKTPASELCNGVDDNCDGQTDNNASDCQVFYSDGDGDGFGSGAGSACMCVKPAGNSVSKSGDCDDKAAAVNPIAKEVCDNLDNNCDGATDEGCDDDGDGWCDIGVIVVGEPLVCPQGKKDCDDSNAAIHPGQSEVCGNGVDDDCDGQTDKGSTLADCVLFYIDADGDGLGAGAGVCLCAASGGYSAQTAGDCDDATFAIHPGGKEVCNGKDDDCNGIKDPSGSVGCVAYYPDGDGDGDGLSAVSGCLCGPSTPLVVSVGGDCNDGDIGVHPGATESCNGIGDDCNGLTDDGVGSLWYADTDGDGYGVVSPTTVACSKPGGYAANSTDCNDGSAAIHPGASDSTCDGVDQDCSGADYCPAVCSPSTLYDFDGIGSGLSYPSGWKVASDPKLNYDNSLQYTNGNGYNKASSGTTATVPLAIPAGATTVRLTYYFHNSAYYNTSTSSPYPDKTVYFAASIGALSKQIGPFSTYQGSPQYLTFTVDSAWWGTTQNMTIKITASAASTDPDNGGFGFDDFEVICP